MRRKLKQTYPLYPIFEFVMWSTAKHRTVDALVKEHEYDYGLAVCLYREADNPVDKEAVAVVCKVADDYEQNRQILGGEARWTTGDDEEKQYVGQLIGYVARKDPKKSALARDEFESLPVRAHLVMQGLNTIIIKPYWPVTVLPDDGVPF